MQIRRARDQDIPQILNVLKKSLGEVSSRKTEEVWRFKHIENPFGKSLVLVAENRGTIVGVRAFMRWKWKSGSNEYFAFRAVDTATHPDYQGKGIFKQLTLKALEIGESEGSHFVFNTPNQNSKPGYLRMGWKEIGKLDIRIIISNPIYWRKNRRIDNYSNSFNKETIKNLLIEWNYEMGNKNFIFTPKNIDYLMWRYINNPLQDYFTSSTSTFFIAGYVKQHSKYKELRISELIYTKKSPKNHIKKEIRRWAKQSGVQFISFHLPDGEKLFNTGISGNFGPVLTLKLMKELDNEIKILFDLKRWAYSLGDLEIF